MTAAIQHPMTDKAQKRVYAYKETPVPASPPTEIEYPESDGEPMGETGYHVRATMDLYSALSEFFSEQDDIYVAADMFMYYEEGNPSACKAPDVMVIKGAGNHERRIFKTWEEQTVPCVIFEVTSKFSIVDDTITKGTVYAQLGVREYILFDPLHEYLSQQLIGFRLGKEGYAQITPDENGNLFSEELGVVLSLEEHYLRVLDPNTAQPVPSLHEAVSLMRQESQRAQKATLLAQQEAQRAERLAAQLRALGIEPEI